MQGVCVYAHVRLELTIHVGDWGCTHVRQELTTHVAGGRTRVRLELTMHAGVPMLD